MLSPEAVSGDYACPAVPLAYVRDTWTCRCSRRERGKVACSSAQVPGPGTHDSVWFRNATWTHHKDYGSLRSARAPAPLTHCSRTVAPIAPSRIEHRRHRRRHLHAGASCAQHLPRGATVMARRCAWRCVAVVIELDLAAWLLAVPRPVAVRGGVEIA
eukprot:6316684-Prymnesium_polylepis.1